MSRLTAPRGTFDILPEQAGRRADLEAVPAATGLPGAPLILDSVADLFPRLT